MDHLDIEDWNEPDDKPRKNSRKHRDYDENKNDGVRKSKKIKKRSHRKKMPKDKLWDDLIQKER